MLEIIQKKLKDYDKMLFAKRCFDGSIEVYRQSPFSRLKHKIYTVQNKFIGSGNWLMKKINFMDTHRHDIVREVARNNMLIRNKKIYSRKMSYDVASMILDDVI